MLPTLLPHLHAVIPYGNHIVTAVAVVFVAIAGGFAAAPVFDRSVGGR